MLPILTDDDLFFTDTMPNTFMRKVISAEVAKFEFQRLPKPYNTNCQMYGNSTRFQCLNECYFDGYMNSDIKCIPNSESLYTFVIEGDIESQRNIFCESEDEEKIETLNKNLRKECDKNVWFLVMTHILSQITNNFILMMSSILPELLTGIF